MGKFSEVVNQMKRRDPELGSKDRSLDEDAAAAEMGAKSGKTKKPIPAGGRGRKNPAYGKRKVRKASSRDLASKL